MSEAQKKKKKASQRKRSDILQTNNSTVLSQDRLVYDSTQLGLYKINSRSVIGLDSSNKRHRID